MTIDLDALLAPIETAPDARAARSAVWAVLRIVKAHCDCASTDEKVDVLAAVDACAWAHGLSLAFRGDALSLAASKLGVRYVRIGPSIPSAGLDLDNVALDPWSFA
jgi:hypothetical protein